MKHLLVLAAVLAVLAALPGCGNPNGQVADLAQQVTHEQAEQNQRMVEGSKAIAEGSRELVEHDAVARKELVELQQDLRQDQTDVARQRDELESERKIIAGQRVQESAAAGLYVALAIILVCLAPLILAGVSLLGLWRSPTPEEEGGILIDELTQSLAQQSGLETPSLPDSSARSLASPIAGR